MVDSIMSYIDPRVATVPVVLYFIGYTIKWIIPKLKNNYIPLILLILGILLCSLIMKAFNIDTVIQGFLVAAASVFTNQLFKQLIEIGNKNDQDNGTAV